MKTGIHPEYVECQVHCSCGNEFVTHSTVPSLRVELCAECHPFYTGKQKLVDTGGRVERFQRRYAKSAKTREEVGDVAREEPRYMGGQAVLEGVMMRGPAQWAVAVRRADGSITTTTGPVAGWSERYRNVPLLRGVTGLGESLALGYRALAWSAERQLEDTDEGDADSATTTDRIGAPEQGAAPARVLRGAMFLAALLFAGVFLVTPAVLGHVVARHVSLSAQVVESAVRLAFFVGYLGLVGLLPDIRRVFQYHGAEHKSIAAYETGVEVTPAEAQRFTTAHVRCGTNFLLTVMVVAIAVYAVVPTPSLPAVIASRVVLIPLIAGLSYEVIRLAARNMHRRWVRAAMKPGLLLQRLTTRQPSLEQLEVAITALRACMTSDQLAEVDARVAA